MAQVGLPGTGVKCWTRHRTTGSPPVSFALVSCTGYVGSLEIGRGGAHEDRPLIAGKKLMSRPLHMMPASWACNILNGARLCILARFTAAFLFGCVLADEIGRGPRQCLLIQTASFKSTRLIATDSWQSIWIWYESQETRLFESATSYVPMDGILS